MELKPEDWFLAIERKQSKMTMIRPINSLRKSVFSFLSSLRGILELSGIFSNSDYSIYYLIIIYGLISHNQRGLSPHEGAATVAVSDGRVHLERVCVYHLK